MSRRVRDERNEKMVVKVKVLKQKLTPVIKVLDFVDKQVVRPYFMNLGALSFAIMVLIIININSLEIEAKTVSVTAKQMRILYHYQWLFLLMLLLLPLLAVLIRLIVKLFEYLKKKRG